jgi:hypothetical protein
MLQLVVAPLDGCSDKLFCFFSLFADGHVIPEDGDFAVGDENAACS